MIHLILKSNNKLDNKIPFTKKKKRVLKEFKMNKNN